MSEKLEDNILTSKLKTRLPHTVRELLGLPLKGSLKLKFVWTIEKEIFHQKCSQDMESKVRNYKRIMLISENG